MSTEASRLKEGLKDQRSSAVRSTSARALGDIGPEAKGAVAALILALKDPERAVRYWAAWALGAIGPEAKEAVAALVVALKDTDAGVCHCAAGALGNIGRPAVLALIEALRDTSGEVRRWAARALGNIGPDAKDAVPALKEVRVRDGKGYVRDAAATAIVLVGGGD